MAQWVKDLVSVQQFRSVSAVGWVRFLAQELPYASGVAKKGGGADISL